MGDGDGLHVMVAAPEMRQTAPRHAHHWCTTDVADAKNHRATLPPTHSGRFPCCHPKRCSMPSAARRVAYSAATTRCPAAKSKASSRRCCRAASASWTWSVARNSIARWSCWPAPARASRLWKPRLPSWKHAPQRCSTHRSSSLLGRQTIKE